MTRARVAWLGALLALALAFVACGLNPQPLPPGADGSETAAPKEDSGAFNGGEAPPAANPDDSGSQAADAAGSSEAGLDAGADAALDGGEDASLDGSADADAG